MRVISGGSSRTYAAELMPGAHVAACPLPRQPCSRASAGALLRLPAPPACCKQTRARRRARRGADGGGGGGSEDADLAADGDGDKDGEGDGRGERRGGRQPRALPGEDRFLRLDDMEAFLENAERAAVAADADDALPGACRSAAVHARGRGGRRRVGRARCRRRRRRRRRGRAAPRPAPVRAWERRGLVGRRLAGGSRAALCVALAPMRSALVRRRQGPGRACDQTGRTPGPQARTARRAGRELRPTGRTGRARRTRPRWMRCWRTRSAWPAGGAASARASGSPARTRTMRPMRGAPTARGQAGRTRRTPTCLAAAVRGAPAGTRSRSPALDASHQHSPPATRAPERGFWVAAAAEHAQRVPCGLWGTRDGPSPWARP